MTWVVYIRVSSPVLCAHLLLLLLFVSHQWHLRSVYLECRLWFRGKNSRVYLSGSFPFCRLLFRFIFLFLICRTRIRREWSNEKDKKKKENQTTLAWPLNVLVRVLCPIVFFLLLRSNPRPDKSHRKKKKKERIIRFPIIIIIICFISLLFWEGGPARV